MLPARPDTHRQMSGPRTRPGLPQENVWRISQPSISVWKRGPRDADASAWRVCPSEENEPPSVSVAVRLLPGRHLLSEHHLPHRLLAAFARPRGGTGLAPRGSGLPLPPDPDWLLPGSPGIRLRRVVAEPPPHDPGVHNDP